MVRLFIVDDSPTCRVALRRALRHEAEIEVVGEAGSGTEALTRIESLRPDLVLMDAYLGRESGVALTAEIMARFPMPIIVVSGVSPNDPEFSFRCMEAGAVHAERKPVAANHPNHGRECQRLGRLIRSLARVPVVSRRGINPPHGGLGSAGVSPRAGEPKTASIQRRTFALVAVGASTGGPPQLQALLARLPRPFPLPIAVVQHIARGFAHGMAQWLQESTGHEVVVCERRYPLEPGRIFLAPENCHLRLESRHTLGPTASCPFQGPAVDELFLSAAGLLGPKVIGIIFSGMGKDGAAGIVRLRAGGAMTIAQRPETCVVESMPAAAIQTGKVDFVLAPEEIAALLCTFGGTPARSPRRVPPTVY